MAPGKGRSATAHPEDSHKALLAPDIVAAILNDALPERASLFDLAVDFPGESGRSSSGI
jgi:hypothetical protein